MINHEACWALYCQRDAYSIVELPGCVTMPIYAMNRLMVQCWPWIEKPQDRGKLVTNWSLARKQDPEVLVRYI